METMRFVFCEEKARALGYNLKELYAVLDRLFAEYGDFKVSEGVYAGPDNQNTYNACSAALHRLPATSWFLKVVDTWQWDIGGGPEDCLKAYYETHSTEHISV